MPGIASGQNTEIMPCTVRGSSPIHVVRKSTYQFVHWILSRKLISVFRAQRRGEGDWTSERGYDGLNVSLSSYTGLKYLMLKPHHQLPSARAPQYFRIWIVSGCASISVSPSSPTHGRMEECAAPPANVADDFHRRRSMCRVNRRPNNRLNRIIKSDAKWTFAKCVRLYFGNTTPGGIYIHKCLEHTK